MISEYVKHDVDQKIKTVFSSNEGLQKFFIEHPLKEKLIERVVDDLRKAYIARPELVDRNAILFASESFAILFCKQVLIQKEKEICSETALYQEKLKQDKIKEMHEGIKNADIAEIKEF